METHHIAPSAQRFRVNGVVTYSTAAGGLEASKKSTAWKGHWMARKPDSNQVDYFLTKRKR